MRTLSFRLRHCPQGSSAFWRRLLPLSIFVAALIGILGVSPRAADSCSTAGMECLTDAGCCAGLLCGPGSVCGPACRIGGAYYASGAHNPSNACQSCQPSVSTGAWINLTGSVCNDKNACTRTDRCIAGRCRGLNPVVCLGTSECHAGGLCEPATGLCVNPQSPDGEACDDDDPDTIRDRCQSGLCTGENLRSVVGSSAVLIPRADSCGNPLGRTCESKAGDVVADAMREAYATDFAVTNAGGLSADLTCPTTDSSTDFCPAYSPPPYPITRGQVLSVLASGSAVATLSINGPELKAVLESGVAAMPFATSRYLQVSGLCFTYDLTAAPNNRVTDVVTQGADGSCTGPPIDLSTYSTYTIAISDFMANGGDGFPIFSSDRLTIHALMDEVVSAYVAGHALINPAITGRISCVASGGGCTDDGGFCRLNSDCCSGYCYSGYCSFSATSGGMCPVAIP